MKLKVFEVAQKINIPVVEWSGNCFAISCAMIKKGVVKGARARYGHYLGEVKSGNRFSGKSIVRHGWIEMEDGTIVDPTRWVFENADPYIYVGPNNDEYDIGGNKFKESMLTPPPENDLNEKQFEMEVPDHVNDFLRMLLVNDEQTFSIHQLFWIANLPLTWLDPHMKEVYSALELLGQQTLVPIDNWRLVMEG